MKNTSRILKVIVVVVVLAAIAAGICVLLSSCNYQFIDTQYSFSYAYVELPNGEIVEGEVDSWRDYGDGDQLQVTIDGKTYLTNSTRIVLVSE